LRWVLKGLCGPHGSRVKLEAFKFGGRWVTSEETVVRFVTRLTPNPDAAVAVPTRSPSRRRRASERAAQALEKLGM
jgi:hypothetical protein